MDAPASLVVYSDYQCPACQSLAANLKALYERHPHQVQIVYRHFPLIPIHDKASLAGQAAEAAGEQGKFWEMHDLLFDLGADWRGLEEDAFREWLVEQAEDLDLDVSAFQTALDSGAYAEDMQMAFSQGIASGIPGTPFLFMNGDLLRIAPSPQNLEAMTRLLILRERQYAQYPPTVMRIDQDYQARIRLTQGEVLIQLLPEASPVGVNSFVFLAQEGWYDDTPVFSVDPERRVDFGDPSGTGHGDAGYHFATETDPDVTFNQPGVVALSSAGPDISGSRFFITLAPIPDLNGSRTIIGRVIRGLNLLRALEAHDASTDLLAPPPSKIISIEIETQ
jgi:cyclophilin family peptidyl-prolyl cis-trans isomerase